MTDSPLKPASGIEPEVEAEIAIEDELVGERSAVLGVRGELDMATVPQLEQAFAGLQERGCTRIALDLSETDFVDSTLLALLVDRRRALRAEGGVLAVICGATPLRRIFEITGLEQALGVVGSREEALARLGAEGG